MKSAEGKIHSPAFGRAPSTSTPAFGGSALGVFGSHEGGPPSSRRRSLTPASSAAKDTPPPPPAESLMDSPGLAGPSLATWGTTGRPAAGTGGIEAMATSPIENGDVSPARIGTRALGLPLDSTSTQDVSVAGKALRDYEATWVTVYGFGQADVPLVLREFGRCGDILRYGTFDDGPQVNWMHIKFAVSESEPRRHSWNLLFIFVWKVQYSAPKHTYYHAKFESLFFFFFLHAAE